MNVVYIPRSYPPPSIVMAKPTRLILAQPAIVASFSKSPQRIYSKIQISRVLLQNRTVWQLAKHTNVEEFIEFLTEHGLVRYEFRDDKYGKEIVRYSWGKASFFELAVSFKPHAYLCHATATTLHGLAKPKSKAIYLNVEQSTKPPGNGSLTQEAINRAFGGNQRQSNLIYACNRASVTMVSGKNTNRLGVEDILGPNSEKLQVTNLERTLIDIVVRPAYSGGISQILKTYRAAKDRISVDRLLKIFNQLNYVYPYHQPIGFLMQKTGYPGNEYSKLRELGLIYDFFLDHAIDLPPLKWSSLKYGFDHGGLACTRFG